MNDILPFPTQTPVVDTSRVGGVTFATFASPKSPRFQDWAAAIPGLKEPEVVLVRPDPLPPLRLEPFKFHLIDAHQFWAEITEEGEVLEVKLERDDSLKEIIESVLLAYSGDTIIPTRMTWKTTKCPAAASACKALALASDSRKWATQGPDHAVTVQYVPDTCAFGRFTVTASCAARTARTSGRKYFPSKAAIAPATRAEIEQLVKHLQDPDFMAALKPVYESYARRVETLKGQV